MAENLINPFNIELRQKVKKDLTSIPGAWIEFYDDLTIAQIKSAEKGLKDKDMDIQVRILLAQISDWNFCNTENEKLPIAAESIEKLSLKVAEEMFSFLVEIAEDFSSKKKASQKTS
jgi:hypothetical protein